jgi:MFS transporter, DHA2 family, multidrug resistance protein
LGEQDGLPTPQRYWSILSIWLALILAVLDSSITNVALPTIARDLHATAAESIWVVNAYLLAIAIMLLPLSALGEIVEYRRVYKAGLLLFIIASIACTLAHSLEELALARVIQGLGAAGIMSVNGALVRFTYPSGQLGRGVGLNALVIGLAAVAGPSIASVILAIGSWQLLFAVNVPIGIAALLLSIYALPRSPKLHQSLDWISAGLNILAFGLVVMGVDKLTRDSRSWYISLVIILFGVISGAALVKRSLSQSRPLMPIDLLKNPVFGLAVVTSIGSFTAQTLGFVSLPFFLQNILHRTQLEIGLLITPWPVAMALSAPLAGRLSDRYSAAVLGGLGLMVLAIGLMLIAATPSTAGIPDISWRMALCGLGFGFFQAPNNRTLLSAAPRDRSGAAAGMLATARLTGQTLGALVAVILFRASGNGVVMALEAGAAFAASASILSFGRRSYGYLEVKAQA